MLKCIQKGACWCRAFLPPSYAAPKRAAYVLVQSAAEPPQRSEGALTLRTLRTNQLLLAQARHYHVDNRVNQNFPFRYEGASKTRFTVGFVAFVAAGVSVPFLACAFQLYVQYL